MNENILKLRQTIAALEKEQRNTKAQRKSVYYTGERTMTPLEACYKAQVNSTRLRILYAAYGLMRGRKFIQIENHWNGEIHPLVDLASAINDVLMEYGYTMEYEEKKGWFGNTYKVFKENCDEKIICINKQEA